MLTIGVNARHHAAVLSGPGVGEHEGRMRSLLLVADPSRPGWLSVRAARVLPVAPNPPSAEMAVSMWHLDRPARPMDPLDPLAIDAMRGPKEDRLVGELNFRQTHDYEVWAATGQFHRVCLAEFSLDAVPDGLEDELARQGWNFRRWLNEEGLDLAAGLAAFAACPSDADLTSVRWYGAPGRQGAIRRQAADSMPLFAGVIARNPILRACVDRQQSLTDHLRKMLPALGAGGIRRLGKISGGTAEQHVLGEAFTHTEDEDVIGVTRQRRLPLAGSWKTEEAIKWLDSLATAAGGVDLVPSTDEEWQSCSSIWSGMLLPVSMHLGSDTRRISPPGGSWRALHEGLAKDLDWPEGSLPDRRILNVAVVDAVELADLLASDIILPVTCQAVAASGAVPDSQRILGNEPLRACLRQAAIAMLVPDRVKQPCRAIATMVRQGLTRLTTLEGIRGDKGMGVATGSSSWEARCWETPFSGDIVTPNGAMISFIRNREGMREEGSVMRHCIGRDSMGYWKKCWNGKGAAAHIGPGPDWTADAAGRAFRTGATAFFHVGGDGLLTLGALHGYGNARVNATGNPFRNAVHELLEMQDDPGQTRNPDWSRFLAWTTTQEARLAMGTPDDERPWVEICGYDPLEQGRTRALWQEWRELVPGGGRIDEPARAVWRLPAARSALEMVSPSTFQAMAAPARRAPAREVEARHPQGVEP